jgi:hypothetical protein
VTVWFSASWIFTILPNSLGLPAFPAETPARSRAEIEALAEFAVFTLRDCPRGKVWVHEEFPDEVTEMQSASGNDIQ